MNARSLEMPLSLWHVVSFNLKNEKEFVSSMAFTDDLYQVHTQIPPAAEKEYYYRHTEEQSIFYLPPQFAAACAELFNRYSGNTLMLMKEPVISDFQCHRF